MGGLFKQVWFWLPAVQWCHWRSLQWYFPYCDVTRGKVGQQWFKILRLHFVYAKNLIKKTKQKLSSAIFVSGVLYHYK